MQIESLSYSLYNPYLNFIETDFKDLPSTISYNKCVTAVDQDFLDAAIKEIKPDLFQDYEILNLGKCCWNGVLKMFTRQQV